MNVGHVSGGTNAGWRKQKPAHERWVCDCSEATPSVSNPEAEIRVYRLNPGYLAACDDCNQRRPS